MQAYKKGMRTLLLRLGLGSVATAALLVAFLGAVSPPAGGAPGVIPARVPAPWCRV
jgi:hypothetical protein